MAVCLRCARYWQPAGIIGPPGATEPGGMPRAEVARAGLGAFRVPAPALPGRLEGGRAAQACARKSIVRKVNDRNDFKENDTSGKQQFRYQSNV